MNITTHANGTTLADYGFHPSQLAQRKRPQHAETKSKMTTKGCLLAATPNEWVFGAAICKRAGLNPGSRNYTRIKALVVSGELESRSVKRSGGIGVQYRRKPANQEPSI